MALIELAVTSAADVLDLVRLSYVLNGLTDLLALAVFSRLAGFPTSPVGTNS